MCENVPLPSFASSLILILFAGVSACDTSARPRVETADSAGIAIITSRAEAWGERQRWHVGERPRLEIGADEADTAALLDQVRGIAALSGGRIAVADRSASVRLFGADGELIWRAGRRGQGPGEFTEIHDVKALAGDSLAVVDLMGNRITLFDAEGAPARSRRIFQGPSSGFFRALTEDLRLVGDIVPPQRAGASSAPHGVAPVVSFEPSSQTLDTLIERALTLCEPEPRDRCAPAGTAAGLAAGAGWVVAGSAVGPEIHWISTGDGARRISRAPPAAEPFVKLLVGGEGEVWGRGERRPGGGPQVWWVFHPEGHLLGSLEVPHGFDPELVLDSAVVGIARSELGVQSIRVLPLRR